MESVLDVDDDTRMVGNYYTDDYLATDIVKGVTRNRAGTRLLALTDDFLIGLRTALTHECGEAADAVFKSCGRRWGAQFGKKFEAEMAAFYQKPLSEFPLMMFEACLAEAFSRHGWGAIRIDLSRQDKGLLLVELRNAIYADLLEKADAPPDALMAGLLAGMFSHLSGQELDAVQTESKACGGKTNRFVLTLASRIDATPLAGRTNDQAVAALAATTA
ncbi:MAG: 4-vinyl reductase [Gemmataceae bacterium]